MTELLPYSEVDPVKLAGFFYEQAVSNHELLARGLVGFVGRYGESPDMALNKVHKGIADHEAGISQHLAVVDNGEIFGGASISNDSLRRLRVPVADGLGVWPIGKNYRGHGWQIKAWTAELGDERPRLVDAYKSLGQIAQDEARIRGDRRKVTYALEPNGSSAAIDNALGRTGMKHIATTLIADGETRRRVPKMTDLYALQPYDMNSLHPNEMHWVIRGGVGALVVSHITEYTSATPISR